MDRFGKSKGKLTGAKLPKQPVLKSGSMRSSSYPSKKFGFSKGVVNNNKYGK
jgi:hypothetical protein